MVKTTKRVSKTTKGKYHRSEYNRLGHNLKFYDKQMQKDIQEAIKNSKKVLTA